MPPSTHPYRPKIMLAMDPSLTEGMLDPTGLARLAEVATLQSQSRFSSFHGDEARALLAEAELIATGWGAPRMDREALAWAPRLQAIVHCGGSVKPYVSKACFDRGVAVSSTPAANAQPVAEFTLAAILWAHKRVLPIARDYRRGRCWPPRTSFEQIQWEAIYPDLGNYRKRVGVVGASRTGRRVISLLQGFELDVMVFDPYLDRAQTSAIGAEKVSLDRLCEASDTVTLHAPELENTRHMIGAAQLSRMKDGATLINTARASLVDTAALERELESGRLFAILDCTDPFQLPAYGKLHSLHNAFLTPHIAGSLGSEKARLFGAAIQEIARWARGEPFAHPVRFEDLDYVA